MELQDIKIALGFTTNCHSFEMENHWLRCGSHIGWFVKVLVRVADDPLGIVSSKGEANEESKEDEGFHILPLEKNEYSSIFLE